MYAEVLVEYTSKKIDKKFTYLIPENLKNDLKIGMKVKVPFGNKLINGFIINITNESNIEKLKEIVSISDYNFTLNRELLYLGLYIQDTTLCSLISAYQCMLPSSMKIKTIKSNYQKYEEYIVLNDQEKAKEYIQENKRKAKQIELLNRLLNDKRVLKSEYSSIIVNKLLTLGIINIKKVNKYRINKDRISFKSLKLTKQQEKVFNEVSNSFNQNNTFLLYGVTGSGKTEIYMNLIEKVISTGKEAIMLVPEISLTTQIVNRFYQRFGSNVAIFHSGLSEGEKYDEYHKILNGNVKIVVGTRSAVFVPFNNIGIIILDEEQSSNYKQDASPRYHAKDIAIWRSKYHKCPVILGSATPSLESMARSLKGVYKLLTLDNRIGSAKMPKIEIVDMKEEYHKNNLIISDLLDSKIKERLRNNEQVMILLNRRGYNTIITCKNCGYTFKCPHCDITLTYHKSTNNLRCHYCGYTLINTEICPSCKEKALTNYGLGTEKLEQELNNRYQTNIIRMDLDTTTKKGSIDSIIQKIENNEAKIIVGTQMISKGFDFPNVTLVGVINADESLNIPDFRSGERTFELLSQTSGRAGRSNKEGEVILQSFDPTNKTLEYVKNNDYKSLFNYEMNIRKILKYPPYYYLTIIKIASKDYDLASSESKKVFTFLNKSLRNVIILGPTTAALFKFNNIYRFQIILKYKDYLKIKDALINLDSIYKSNSKVNIEIDNNPSRI